MKKQHKLIGHGRTTSNDKYVVFVLEGYCGAVLGFDADLWLKKKNTNSSVINTDSK
jgi:hypothetical protein